MTDPSKETGFPKVSFEEHVLREIRTHGRTSMHAEICGVLIGREVDGETRVTARIGGEKAAERGASVTFTQETWEHIYKVKDEKYPDDAMVGWYHTHPGFGIFLSSYDLFIHKNFFTAPHQIAWVFDPQSGEEGCFGWKDKEIERLPQTSIRFDERPTGAPPANDVIKVSVPPSEPATPSKEETGASPPTQSSGASSGNEPKAENQKLQSILLVLIGFTLCSLVVSLGYLFWGGNDSTPPPGPVVQNPKPDAEGKAQLMGTTRVVEDKLFVEIQVPNSLVSVDVKGKKEQFPRVRILESPDGVMKFVVGAAKWFNEELPVPPEVKNLIKPTSWTYPEELAKDVFVFTFDLEPLPPPASPPSPHPPMDKPQPDNPKKDDGSPGKKWQKKKESSLGPSEDGDSSAPTDDAVATPAQSPSSDLSPGTAENGSVPKATETGSEAEAVPSPSHNKSSEEPVEPEPATEENASVNSGAPAPESLPEKQIP